MSVRQWQNTGGEVTIGVVDGEKGTITTMAVDRGSAWWEAFNPPPAQSKPTRGGEIAARLITYDGNWVNFETENAFGISATEPSVTARDIRKMIAAAIDDARAEMKEACIKACGWTCTTTDPSIYTQGFLHGRRDVADAIRALE
jgi:hypothetical protein